MGYRIAITGLVMAVFFLLIGMLAQKPPVQRNLMAVCGLLMLTGMFMFPIGLIIQIWQ